VQGQSGSTRKSKASPGALDRIDRQILRTLQKKGRITISELAKVVHLTTTPCYERVKRLEREGIIRGYAALVDPKRLGLSLLVFVEVRVDRTTPDIMGKFQAAVQRFNEVVECHMVAGGFDYLIKIRVADMEAYRRFLSANLASMPGVKQTRTYIVMEEVKCSSEVAA
jgi:Lrp/AsnC family transcriptional regulator, leucine-responsive regulatory protein